MMNSSEIREHMKVVGSDGQHVGTVDKVEGSNIKLTKNDPMASGQHHILSMDMVDSVENEMVRLNMSAQEAMSQWQSDDGMQNNTQSASAAGAGAGAGSWSSMSGSDTSMPNQGSMGTSSSDDDSQRGTGSMGYK